mgnify:FL=1
MINFEIFGYSVDYRLNGRYIGSVTIEKPDRDKMGYYGKKIETLTKDLVLKNKKYKKGTIVTTECYPLCGKYIGTRKEKLSAIYNSRIGYER